MQTKYHLFCITTLRDPLSKPLLFCSVYFMSKKSDVACAVLKKPRSVPWWVEEL